MFRNFKENIFIVVIVTIFAVVFSEFLVHIQMINFWTDQEFSMGYWLGFWTPLIDGIAVAVLALYLRSGYEEKLRLKNKELEDQKKEFETMYQSSRDGIAIMDLSSRFLDCNEAYLKMLGYTKEELLKTTCIDLAAPEDKQRSIEALKIALEKGYLDNLEKKCQTKNGNRLIINMTATLLPNKKHFLVITKDVTALKQIESQEKNAAMGEMIGNIAHQWRQPLNIISTASTAITYAKEYGTLTDEHLMSLCKSINDNVQYLSETIDDFKNFIKGDRKLKNFTISDNIDSLIRLIKGSTKEHEIIVIKDIPKDLILKGYPNELLQCYLNLYNNTKDAYEEKQIENKFLFIKAYETNEDIIISFKDNAGGIASDILPRIFEPYFTTKHKSLGTGLGLSMTYKLITEGMQGDIEVDSVEYIYNGIKCAGTEFLITFKK